MTSNRIMYTRQQLLDLNAGGDHEPEFELVDLSQATPKSKLKGPIERTGASDKGDEKKEVKSKSTQDRLMKLAALIQQPKLAGKGGKGGLKNLKVKAKLYVGGTLGVSASAGKYLLVWGSNPYFGVNNVQVAQEWNSWDSLFDEFFVLSMKIKYQPNNKYSANNAAGSSAAGSPGYVNTCGVTFAAYQHDQPTAADTSSSYVRMMPASKSTWANLGDRVNFTWRNVEKFHWDSVELPNQASTGGQTWMNVSSVNTYGGYVQAATPYPSGASAGIGVLLEGAVFGFFMAEFTVAFRCRS